MDTSPRAREQNKNNQSELHQTETLLLSEGNHQRSEKTADGRAYSQMVCPIRGWSTKQRVNSHNSITHTKTNNNPIEKWPEDVKRHFSEEDMQMPADLGKGLRGTHQQGKASQTHSEMPPHTWQRGYHQEVHRHTCWGGCGLKGALVHCWGECRLVQPPWEAGWRFLKLLK